MTALLDFADSSADLLPDIPADLVEPTCAIPGCDNVLVSSGRGRPPTKCPEHKRTATPAGAIRKPAGTTKSAKNDTAARSAAAALAQMNDMLAMVLVLPFSFMPPALFLPKTAAAISEANGSFEEAAYQALVTDPKLCALILKAGATGGKFALIAAYGMLAMAIVPTAVIESRENTASRAVAVPE